MMIIVAPIAMGITKIAPPRDGGDWWAAIYGAAQSGTTEVTQQQQYSYGFPGG